MLEQDAQRMWTRWNRALAADREYYANEDAKYNPGEDSDSDDALESNGNGAREPEPSEEDTQRLQREYNDFLKLGARADTTQLATPNDDYSPP